MRSTQEWEKALEEATPGPWEAKRYGHEWIVTPVVPIPVTTDVGSEDYGNLRYVADVHGEENAHLVALAPEAVAELIAARRENERLRRELEALRDMVSRRASMSSLPGIPNQVIEQRITRILEGTHE